MRGGVLDIFRQHCAAEASGKVTASKTRPEKKQPPGLEIRPGGFRACVARYQWFRETIGR